MTTVHKYLLPKKDECIVFLPAGAQPLTAQMQGDELCLWVLVNPDPMVPKAGYLFRIAGTGHPIAGEWSYLSTVHLNDGRFILHVFWRLA